MSKTTTPDLSPMVASAYAIVSREEEQYAGSAELPTAVAAYATAVHHDDVGVNVHMTLPAGHRRISPEFRQLLGGDGDDLTWNDDFFDDYNEENDNGENDRIVAVFDFDYTGMECHYKTLSWSCFATTAICLPSFLPLLLLSLVPCYINQNVRWNVRAQHLAVTSRGGVVFCHDTRPTCWGGNSCMVAKRTKVIPLDQIGNVVVVSEAGSNATCLLDCSNSLSTVNVDSKPGDAASNGGNNATTKSNKTELVIVGLQNPNAFRKVVMAMKRANSINDTLHYRANAAVAHTAASMLVQQQQQMVRGTTTNEGTTTTNERLAVLLREIRDELRQSNNQVHATAVAVQGATAPPSHCANEII
jgi:hypothetical protein